MKFDLFKLYVPNEDVGSRSHIGCNGKELILFINNLINEMISKGDKIYYISKRIAEKLRLHPDTVLKMFRQRNKEISLAVIINLIDEWKRLCNKQNREVIKTKEEIIDKIEGLTSGTASRTDIIAVKRLNVNLAKIMGAHHADGHLCKELTPNGTSYKIIIIDHYKSNLIAFKKWMHFVFGIKLKVKKAVSDAWIIEFRNKVVGRYFEKVFGFPTGDKTFHNLPEIIKNSNNKIKNAYLLGFMSFEGSVELDKTISLGIRNKTLRDEIYTIFLKDLNIKKRKNKNAYHIRSFNTNNSQLTIWKNYFEPNTDKWLKIEFFLGNYHNKNIFLDRNKKERFNVIINELKKCSMDKFELAKRLNIGVTTLHSYLRILLLSEEIKKTNIPSSIPNINYNQEDAKIFLKDSFHNKFFIELENLNKKELMAGLNISEGTYYNWKSGRNGISFSKIKEIEKLLNIKVTQENIEKFNKKIIELNH